MNASLKRGCMTQKHKHLIVRADIGWCPKEEDLNTVSDWIRTLIKKIEMKLLAGPTQHMLMR